MVDDYDGPNFREQPLQVQTGKRDQLLLDLEGLLGRPEGRRVVMWFLELCNVYGMQFTGEDNATNFTLGKRDVGIGVILKLNEVSPTAYPQLLLDAARDKGEQKAKVHVADE